MKNATKADLVLSLNRNLSPSICQAIARIEKFVSLKISRQ